MTTEGQEPQADHAFVERPSGQAAAVVGGGLAGPEHATRISLQTRDGGVLVRSIQRQTNGTYIGEVFAVTPRQRSVAVGDLVTFRESQIFSFKPAEAQAATGADPELDEMIRTFEDSFRSDSAAPGPSRARTPKAAEPDIEVSLDPPQPHVRLAAREETPPPSPRARVEGRAAALAAQTPAPKASEPDLSVADAYAVLGGVPEEAAKPEEKRVEPAIAPPALVPVTVPTPPPAREETLVEKRSLTCVECGALLTYTPAPDAATGGQRRKTVSCPECGRINNVPPGSD